MSKTKAIVFQYFQVVLQKEYKEKDQIVWKTQKVFDFVNWLRTQRDEGNIKKNFNINNDFQGNLESVANSSINPNIWFARFYKLRDIVPAKVKDGIGAESIDLGEDEYIGEDVCILYDDTNGVCMLQKNRFSLSYLKIAEWLTLSCNEGYRVILKPINDSNIFNKLDGKNIRSFDISFANLNNNIESTEKSSLNQIIKSVQYFDGVVANIRIGVGRQKHRRLNKSAARALLQELQSYENRFSKAKVTLSDENDSNIEILDLLDAIMSSTLYVTIKERKMLDFHDTARKMQLEYDKKKEELSKLKIFPR